MNFPITATKHFHTGLKKKIYFMDDFKEFSPQSAGFKEEASWQKSMLLCITRRYERQNFQKNKIYYHWGLSIFVFCYSHIAEFNTLVLFAYRYTYGSTKHHTNTHCLSVQKLEWRKKKHVMSYFCAGKIRGVLIQALMHAHQAHHPELHLHCLMAYC